MKDEILVELGNNIRKIRIEKKLNQEDLAKISKLHRNYISDVERGTRNISVKALNKISAALEISIADLFD